MRTEWITTQGCRLRALVAGTGPRGILCWPGTGLPAEEFLSLAHALESDFQVAAIDPPGHGQSEPWSGAWNWSDAVRATQDVLTHLDLKAPLLVGHSLGGTTLLMIRPAIPSAGLIVIDGAFPMAEPYPTYEAAEASMNAWMADTQAASWDAFFEAIKPDLHHWDADVQAGVRAMMRETTEGLVPRLDPRTIAAMLWNLSQFRLSDVEASDSPTLLLYGRNNPPDAEHIHRLHSRLFALRSAECPSGGHDLLWDAPQWIAEQVRSYAAQVDWRPC